jgi:hypothetical protein
MGLEGLTHLPFCQICSLDVAPSVCQQFGRNERTCYRRCHSVYHLLCDRP